MAWLLPRVYYSASRSANVIKSTSPVSVVVMVCVLAGSPLSGEVLPQVV